MSKSDVDICKENVITFVRKKIEASVELLDEYRKEAFNLHYREQIMVAIEEIVSTFGWELPGDTVATCACIFKRLFPEADTSKWIEEFDVI